MATSRGRTTQHREWGQAGCHWGLQPESRCGEGIHAHDVHWQCDRHERAGRNATTPSRLPGEARRAAANEPPVAWAPPGARGAAPHGMPVGARGSSTMP
eukprot:2749151-Alexandrium_andersonii.AAC.1